jgi:AcrR family transcriptional regulator
MARWEPNARERLERAALELFTQHGYDATTVAQIADRAGLSKSTFFRHFSDKREVLFGGQDIIADRFAEAIAAAPAAATTADCLAAALGSVSVVFIPERRDLAPRRQAVIAATSELEERQLLKRAHLADAIDGALRARGTDDTTARLAAQLGVLAFSTAYTRWAASGSQRPYAALAREALHELQARAAVLGQPS